MVLKWKWLATAGILAASIGAAQAQEKLKVGIMVTLSGPSAVLGQQARDGFQLAVRQLGGKLGGIDTELVGFTGGHTIDGCLFPALRSYLASQWSC